MKKVIVKLVGKKLLNTPKKKVMVMERGKCPKCNSNNLSYGAEDFEEDFMSLPTRCNACKWKGREWYRLIFTEYSENDRR